MWPETRKPPHLPFISGPANTSPGITQVSPEEWLFPDTEARAWLNDKRLLMKLMRDKVSGGELDGDAARELLAMILGASGETPLQKTPTALEEAASLVSDDLCLLEKEQRGDWRLSAAVLCAPTYWSLPERLGLDLGGLHGPVPGGDQELAGRIGRIFSGLQPDRILRRFNWTVQAGSDRHTPERPSVAGADIHSLHLRVERQTIRKLPRTGAIVFTIRICMDPLLPILRDQHYREKFEDAWLGTEQRMRSYKGWDDLEGLVAEACRHAARGL